MLFNSFIFLIFLAVVIPLYYAIPAKYRNWLLLIASYFFYGYWDYRFLSLIIISTLVDYYVGKELGVTIDKQKRKYLLWISMISNLGILGFFKYFGFFVSTFAPMAAIFGGNLDYLHLNLILPVGISFYTFQTMSYTIDIYRGTLKPTNKLLDFAVFVAFFPQLVAGPIERAKNLLPQIINGATASKEQMEKGIHLIVTGLFMKVMIGDTTGRFVDHMFAHPELYKSPELLMALILFSIQIYADFAGYSSIARGTAKLMGFELMKNFEQPYLSQNITEFWRRWHISLSSWLKDYLYISLGGNRKGNFRTYVNLMITMLLGGLWHGASWNFVIWGGLHGVYLAVHKMMIGNRGIAGKYQYNGIVSLMKYLANVAGTFMLVLFAWLFFRSTSWETTTIFFNKMINWESSEFTMRLLSITITFVVVTLLMDVFQYHTGRHTFLMAVRSKAISAGILSALFIITLLYMFQSDPLPFVYFQF
jgi:alginate O-acetyltransferase complex protein AlgI